MFDAYLLDLQAKNVCCYRQTDRLTDRQTFAFLDTGQINFTIKYRKTESRLLSNLYFSFNTGKIIIRVSLFHV